MADIIDLIKQDHDEIRRLFAQLESSAPEDRGGLFAHIVPELARHEAAEEAIVHPTLRHEAREEAAADEIVEQEQHAEELMADMEDLDPTSDEFLARFRELRDDVVEHARYEEDIEHPRLRELVEEARLVEMAEGFRRVKQVAPTRPHPSASNAPEAQLTLGPIVGVFDRARDAVRDALSEE